MATSLREKEEECEIPHDLSVRCSQDNEGGLLTHISACTSDLRVPLVAECHISAAVAHFWAAAAAAHFLGSGGAAHFPCAAATEVEEEEEEAIMTALMGVECLQFAVISGQPGEKIGHLPQILPAFQERSSNNDGSTKKSFSSLTALWYFPACRYDQRMN